MKRLYPSLLACALAALSAAPAFAGEQGGRITPAGETIHAVMTAPPMVPPPITRKTPAHVVVDLEMIEKEKKAAQIDHWSISILPILFFGWATWAIWRALSGG